MSFLLTRSLPPASVIFEIWIYCDKMTSGFHLVISSSCHLVILSFMSVSLAMAIRAGWI
jgi:hypothetical protein